MKKIIVAAIKPIVLTYVPRYLMHMTYPAPTISFSAALGPKTQPILLRALIHFLMTFKIVRSFMIKKSISAPSIGLLPESG